MQRVSIHALLAECDGIQARPLIIVRSFNPRTPCGVRLGNGLREKHERQFQSTHSLRSATAAKWAFNLVPIVSIHALLAECDEYFCFWFSSLSGFNPRTPCGVRRVVPVSKFSIFAFQSTHSLRSATYYLRAVGDVIEVSIHALLAECDSAAGGCQQQRLCFNPRTPCGVRPETRPCPILLSIVSIHALLAECDGRAGVADCRRFRFNPRTPCGVRRVATDWKAPKSPFQSTHSLRSAT